MLLVYLCSRRPIQVNTEVEAFGGNQDGSIIIAVRSTTQKDMHPLCRQCGILVQVNGEIHKRVELLTSIQDDVSNRILPFHYGLCIGSKRSHV
jgi:hypothetical protein